MSVKKMIENELVLEKRILNKLKKHFDEKETVIIGKDNGRRRQFLIREEGETRQRYVKKSEHEELEKAYNHKLIGKIIKNLEYNIKAFEKMIGRIKEYDYETVAKELPRAYRLFRESARYDEASKEALRSIPQSENPKDRVGLKYKTSFGLFVRSKNEMLIAEALYAAGFDFWYEKRLELIVEVNGKYNTHIVYPDFTIRLQDGTLIYWEHYGMMDKPSYQSENFMKLQQYFANGIYPPKNLILTFDGDSMPFDNSGIWRIIEGQLAGR